MQAKNPLLFQEVIKLTALAIDPKSFKFGVTTFESDKYISIKDLSAVNFSFIPHFFKFFLSKIGWRRPIDNH